MSKLLRVIFKGLRLTEWKQFGELAEFHGAKLLSSTKLRNSAELYFILVSIVKFYIGVCSS